MHVQVAAMLQRASTPEQWSKMAHELFNARHYDQAAACFERAGDGPNVLRAKVRGGREGMGKTRGTLPQAFDFFLMMIECQVHS